MAESKDNEHFHDKLKRLMDELNDVIYTATSVFPQSELYGLTSQMRRSSISITLNYIEGYARQRPSVTKNFLEISYGSLKELNYLVYFSHKRKYLNNEYYGQICILTEEIGKMVWSTMQKIKV